MIKNTHFKAHRTIFLLGVIILVTVILSVNLISASEWTEDLNVDLLLYYDFNDTDESISHVHNLTANEGTMNYTENGALIGKSGRFTTGNNLKINSTTETNLGLYNSTLNFWAYVDNRLGDTDFYINIENGIVLNLQARGVGDLYTSGIINGISGTEYIPQAIWHMVTIVHNGTDANIYLNGTLIRTGTKNIGTANSNVMIGVESGNNYDLIGYMDEMSWWNRSLSGDEITQLWNNSYGITYIPTVSLIVTLNSPVNNSNITTTRQFNITTTPSTHSLTNATFYMWYPNGTIFNTTINDSLSGNQPVNVLFNISGIPLDTLMSWNVKGCQGNGAGINCSFATNNFTATAKKILEETQIYNSQATEGTLQTFNINVSISPEYAISQGNFIYNGTSYAGSFFAVDTMMYQFTRTITLPLVTANTNVSFYWDITLTDATEFNSSTNNQTIFNLGIDNCSSFSIEIFNFTLVNEETQTALNGATDNTSIKIDIDLYSSSGSTNPVIEFFSFYNETNPVGVCISAELNESYYYLDAQIEYNADGYVHEFYHIQNYILNGTSNPLQNITLYDLSDDDAQAFTISYKDESFLAVEEALIQIQRKYIEEGVFKTVEIPKTDSKGETIGQLVLNDVIYSFTIVRQGEVLAVFDNVYAVCQNPAITECEINLNSFSSTIEATDFYTSEDFAFTLNYDRLTRTITSVFSIPSGAVSTVVLNVTKEDALGTEICSESITTSAGILTCVVGNNFGNGTVIAKLYSDGVLKGQGQINLAQSPIDIYGASLVFLGLLIMLTLVGAGVSDNPVFTSIFLIVGAILLFALNLVAHSGFIGAGATILWIIIAIILIIIKGGRRT